MGSSNTQVNGQKKRSKFNHRTLAFSIIIIATAPAAKPPDAAPVGKLKERLTGCELTKPKLAS